MIHYLPLERIETRYTAHLDDSITEWLVESGEAFRRYYPDTAGRAEAPPPHGFFLNSTGTIEFKTKQVAMLAEFWDRGVKDGDIIFTSDLWHPGIEAVGYMSHFTKTKVRLRGIVWAGTFTEHDLIRPVVRWGEPYELSFLQLAEKVFLGSEDERQTICDAFFSEDNFDESKLIVTGAPLDAKLDQIEPATERHNIVAWNGRMSYEKQPHLVAKLNESLFGSGTAVNITERHLSKLDYYRYLAKAKVVVSFALEETFGFAVQEAVKLGCVPVLPNRLCYPEQFPPEYLYDSWSECVQLVKAALRGELPVPPLPVYDPLPMWFEGC